MSYLAFARAALADSEHLEAFTGESIVTEVVETVPGITPAELRELLSNEERATLDSGEFDIDFLIAGARAYLARKTRERGERPEGWNSRGICRQCGPV